MRPIAVTQEEWEQEVGTLVRRGMPYIEPDVSSYLAGVLAHPEKAPSTHEQLKIQHALACGTTIAAEDSRTVIGAKLQEKAGHLIKVGEGCLVIAAFYRLYAGTLPVIPLGEASYRGTAMLAATEEGVCGAHSEYSPEVCLVIGDNFRDLTKYLAGWISGRFKPQPLFRQHGTGDFRYSTQ